MWYNYVQTSSYFILRIRKQRNLESTVSPDSFAAAAPCLFSLKAKSLELEHFIWQGLSFGFSQKPNNQSLLSYWWVNIKLQTSLICVHYRHEWMSKILYTRISTQDSVFRAPDAHMHASLTYIHMRVSTRMWKQANSVTFWVWRRSHVRVRTRACKQANSQQRHQAIDWRICIEQNFHLDVT